MSLLTSRVGNIGQTFLEALTPTVLTAIKRLTTLFLSLIALLLSISATEAITAIARSFDELVARADTVFKGEVTAKNSQWIGEGATRHIVTFVTCKVEETYKGAPATEQTLRFLGGTVGNDTMEVPDMPQFMVGQKAVLFVVGNGKQFCPLVGVAQGRFHVVRDEAMGHERVFTNEGAPVVNTTEIGRLDEAGVPRLQHYTHTNAQPMTVDDFKSAILGKVAALPR